MKLLYWASLQSRTMYVLCTYIESTGARNSGADTKVEEGARGAQSLIKPLIGIESADRLNQLYSKGHLGQV